MIEAAFEDTANPGAARNTTLNLTALPDPSTQEEGTVYEEDGFLRIIVPGIVFPSSGNLVLTGFVPTVVVA